MAFKIYRVEVLDSLEVGKGCYTGFLFSGKGDMCYEHANNVTHPGIRQEFDDWYRREEFYRSHYCAFRNVKQMTLWFGKWLSRMIDEGLVVNEYLVKDFLDCPSKKQIMFHPTNILKRKTVISSELSSESVTRKVTKYLVV